MWKTISRKPNQKLNNRCNGVDLVLPDVLAGISYGEIEEDTGSSSADTTMIGYSSRFPDLTVKQEQGRESRSCQRTVPQDKEMSQRVETNLSRVNVQFYPKIKNIANHLPIKYNINSLDTNAHENHKNSKKISSDRGTLQGARIRSSSSGHHRSWNIGSDNHRTRCSSATRNHSTHQSDLTNVPLNLPLHPNNSGKSNSGLQSIAFQQIEYQQDTSVNSELRNLVQISSPCEVTMQRQNERREDLIRNISQLGKNLLGSSYGYQVPDLEALLSHATPSRPANLPMVLASSARLHNMRKMSESYTNDSQLPIRPVLPLGVIVNAIYKTRDWLYVRSAHGLEGYVPYRICLPLGILPATHVSATSTMSIDTDAGNSASAWEIRKNEQITIPDRDRNHLPKLQISLPQEPRSRGRQRSRRTNAETTNQTDIQKLRPDTRMINTWGPRDTLSYPLFRNGNTNIA